VALTFHQLQHWLRQTSGCAFADSQHCLACPFTFAFADPDSKSLYAPKAAMSNVFKHLETQCRMICRNNQFYRGNLLYTGNNSLLAKTGGVIAQLTPASTVQRRLHYTSSKTWSRPGIQVSSGSFCAGNVSPAWPICLVASSVGCRIARTFFSSFFFKKKRKLKRGTRMVSPRLLASSHCTFSRADQSTNLTSIYSQLYM
jgi:hypothetical protein